MVIPQINEFLPIYNILLYASFIRKSTIDKKKTQNENIRNDHKKLKKTCNL